MKQVTLYDKLTGELGPQVFNDPDFIDQMCGTQWGAIDGAWSQGDHMVNLDDLTICERQPDIQQLRDRAWYEIKNQRDKRANGTAATPLGLVDCDEASRTNINGAVLMATIAQAAGQPFVIDWTMASGEPVEHDAVEMIAMGLAVGHHVATCHATSQQLKRLIADAETMEQLDAIVWPTEAPPEGQEANSAT